MSGNRPAMRSVPPPGDAVLSALDLHVVYHGDAGATNHAVAGVDISLRGGEILGLVGESGSGKSSLALGLAGLLPGGARMSAVSLTVAGRPVALSPGRTHARERRSMLGRDIGVVFQDPTASLDPTMTVGKQIAEPLRVHTRMDADERRARVDLLIDRTGLAGVPNIVHRYPHQLSGGQRQRVMIALALACEPKVIIADEPTTALDVTVQAEILTLFRSLRQDLGVSILFVSHDLAVVGEIADRVAVMYAGRIVEIGPTADVLDAPQHPYPAALLRCAPTLGGGRRPLAAIDVSGAAQDADVAGCAYAPRCPRADDGCRSTRPVLTGSAAHSSACFHPAPVPRKVTHMGGGV